jgi:acyl-CoA thioesterase I
MAVGMARSTIGLRVVGAVLAAAGVLAVAGVAAAQSTPPEPPAIAKECGEARASDAPLPNSSIALQQRKKLKILAIGASSAAVLGIGRGGGTPLLERILERTVKGLDVEIINRGFSGELAEAAGERLKIEVALNHPDIVLWQVGTNDALAHVPVESFHLAVSNAVRWLKAHKIDVILVGLHYMRQLAKDEHYQAIRASLRKIASAENVLRVGRYEAMEVLTSTMQASGQLDPEDFGLTEAGYNCMAQYIARTITVGIFAKPPKYNALPK